MESLKKIRKKALEKEKLKKDKKEMMTCKWFKQLCKSIGNNKNEEKEKWEEIMLHLSKKIKKNPNESKYILCYIGPNETELELSNLYPYSYDAFGITSEKMFNSIHESIRHLDSYQIRRIVKKNSIIDICHVSMSSKIIENTKIIALEISFSDELCILF